MTDLLPALDGYIARFVTLGSEEQDQVDRIVADISQGQCSFEQLVRAANLSWLSWSCREDTSTSRQLAGWQAWTAFDIRNRSRTWPSGIVAWSGTLQ